jgi:3-isopropylmalate dehydrogenase
MHEAPGSARPVLAQHLGEAWKPFDPAEVHHIGVLEGEGVGPEIVPVALEMLDVLRTHTDRRIELTRGGDIGYPAMRRHGRALSSEVIGFAQETFARRGALFCGPGGERFVYQLRQEFGLFCKFTPIEPLAELAGSGVVREDVKAGADMIAVRENMGGIYQGSWQEEHSPRGKLASHSFQYDERTVRDIMQVAASLAASRRGRVHVVLKPGGVPAISALWGACAEEICRAHAVELHEQEIDNAVYQLIANPAQFDVVVSPNMFGDVLADCAALLLASRGLSYSGNFTPDGIGVFQTGHGAARDIAGQGIANPTAQIFSLGMMLRECFAWPQADAALREAVRMTLSDGLCTGDVAREGWRVLNTVEYGAEVKARLQDIAPAMLG